MSGNGLKSLTPLIEAVIKLVANVAASQNGDKNTPRSFSINRDQIQKLIPVVYVAWAKFADAQTRDGDKGTEQHPPGTRREKQNQARYGDKRTEQHPPGARRESLKEFIHVVLDALDKVADAKPLVGGKPTRQTPSKGGGELMKLIPVAAAKISSLGQKLGDKSAAGPDSKWNILADIPKLVTEVMAERQWKAQAGK